MRGMGLSEAFAPGLPAVPRQTYRSAPVERSTQICTPETATKLQTDREKALQSLDHLCSTTLQLCTRVLQAATHVPNAWEKILGSGVLLTPYDRMNIRSQIYEIRSHVEEIFEVAEGHIDAGHHPFVVIFDAWCGIIKMQEWIESIVSGNSLPESVLQHRA